MGQPQKPNDLITTTAARELLGVGRTKMADLLNQGVLQHWTNPLDARKKLVSRAAVLALQDRRDKAA
jgi:hypothetical protein